MGTLETKMSHYIYPYAGKGEVDKEEDLGEDPQRSRQPPWQRCARAGGQGANPSGNNLLSALNGWRFYFFI